MIVEPYEFQGTVQPQPRPQPRPKPQVQAQAKQSLRQGMPSMRAAVVWSEILSPPLARRRGRAR